jgi:flagellar protein FliS
MMHMFTANSRTAMNAYRSVGVESLVESASPNRLVLMLFDGARAAVSAASAHLRSRNIAAKCVAITQAIAIIDGGLKASLDLNVGGDLAKNLSDLYIYMTQRLLQANLNNDPAALEEVSRLLDQLGGAWEVLAATRAAPAAKAGALQPARGAAISYGTT